MRIKLRKAWDESEYRIQKSEDRIQDKGYRILSFAFHSSSLCYSYLSVFDGTTISLGRA